jgi:hypothetical protein
MLTIVIRKLTALVKAAVIVLVALLVLPKIVTASCSSVLSDRTIDETDITTWIVQVREMGELECASYSGAVCLEEEVGKSFLGVRTGTIRIFLAAEGSTVASVDLTEVTREDVRITANCTSVQLPAPRIAYCEVNPRWDVYPASLPHGSADNLARVEDSMVEESRALLCQQALRNGILDQARQEARNQAVRLARASGLDCQVQVEFEGGGH